MTATDPTMATLTKLLDVAGLRHRVISQNVANVNTPGYRRREVTFAETLDKASGGTAKVEVVDGPERVDGNTVDIDREMGDLTRNGLLYQAASQLLANRLSSLRSAIAGR
jgi:flagellar basal-body rod protein FlgB